MYICMCVDTYSKDWREIHQNVHIVILGEWQMIFPILCVLFCLV